MSNTVTAGLPEEVERRLTHPSEKAGVPRGQIIRDRLETAQKSAGRHILRLCRAEHCRLAGSEELTGHLERGLGIRIGQTTADGRITLSPIYCLGNCSHAPSALFDEECYGGVTSEMLDSIVEECRSE